MELTLNEAQVSFAHAVVEADLIELDTFNQWLMGLTEVPQDLGEGLCKSNLISEFELVRGLAQHLQLSIASDIELEMYATPHPMISRDLCVELLFVPLDEDFSDPFPIAISNPLDEEGLSYLCELLNVTSIKTQIAAASHIRNEITACYGTAEEWELFLAEQANDLNHENNLREPLNEDLSADHQLLPPQEVSASQRVNETISVLNPADPQDKRPTSLPDWAHLNSEPTALFEGLTKLINS